MAGIAYCFKRLWNPGRHAIFGDTDNVLGYCERPLPNGQMPRYIEIGWIGETQAGEELGTAPGSDKDGTTTPYQVVVVSSSANDTNTAAGHVRKVAVIGVTVSSIQEFIKGEDPILSVEVFNMNGTSDVTSTRYYLWVVHAYACDWGSGDDDAAGNITIEAPANTTLYQITANQNEAEGGRLHFAAGDIVLLDQINFGNTATLAAGDGVILSTANTDFEDTLNGDPDFATDYYSYIHYGNHPLRYSPCWMLPRKATNQSMMIFTETLVANAKTIKIHIGVKLMNRAKRNPKTVL